MHIPDGYLSPQTSAVMYIFMAPLWVIAAKIARATLKTKQVPYLAIGSAFTFVIMMFNIPIPGGSTGHPIGGTLVSILFGPWAALIAITVSLTIQAFLFGDGGILTLGANCFNMAFVLPFSGYFVYKLISFGKYASHRRKIFAAFIGSYIGLNLAALVTAVEFGIQPLLFHTRNGQPLYCPYGLGVAIPVMMFEHLVFFGWAEAIITATAFSYLLKQDLYS